MMNSKASIPIEIEIKRDPRQVHFNQQQHKSSPRHSSALKIATTTTTTTKTTSTSAAASTTPSSKLKPIAKENNSQFIADSISNQNQCNKRNLSDFENQFVEKVFTNEHLKLNNRNTDDNKLNNMHVISSQPGMKYKTNPKEQYQHLQNLSPIKPSFVNLKEETTPLSAANNAQFVHSTPNHNSYQNMNDHNFVATSTARSSSLSPPKYMSRLTKKQMIVKELAVNILELNGYRTRTQQLDNELNNFNRIRKENQTSSKGYVDLTEKTEDIKSELEKLKSDMLRKIDDIRGLEQELVKIEGQNISTSLANRNPSHMQIHRNEEVMNEIKNMLKDTMGNDPNAATNTIQTVSQVYEEYHKSTMSNRELVRGMKSPSQTKARSLSSSHEKTTMNSCNLAEIFRIKIEQKYSCIKSQSKALEDFLSKCEDNKQRSNQIECFINVVRSIQENLNNEKHYLFVELKNQPIYLNPIIMNNLKNNIENLLNEKLVETEKLINFFKSKIDCKENIQLINTVLNNNSHNNNSESSFLTEEEECIKKISERIVQLKERIHLKETQPRSKKSKGNYNDLSSDDSDTKELRKLNEQIRVLKSRMIAKGDQLNKVKKLSGNNFFVYQHSTATTTNSTTNNTKNARPIAIPSSSLPTQSIHTSTSNQFSQACTGPIYLPINHQPRRAYKIEPLLSSNADYAQQEYESDFNGSPSRKYISSIEIPAEQLEELKNQRASSLRRRTKSMSSTTSDEEAIEHSHNHQKYHKRHKSVVHFKNAYTDKELNSKNLLQVSLKSTKLPQPEKQTMTEENSDLERIKRENDQLRADLIEKETVIEKLSAQSTETSENLNKLIEQQNIEIVNLKNELNLKDERKMIKNISVQTEQKNIANLIESSLICNIPEHHHLEDMVHENREQIANLKSYLKKVNSQSSRFNDDVDDLDLIEKKAEFEALDLAINERKQQLLNLEFYNRRKRRFKSGSNYDIDEPDEDNEEYYDEHNQDYSLGSSVNRFIQDEIACIEKTLKRRNTQLRQVESEIRSAHKELLLAKNQKKLIEKETECLKKKNSKFSQEACIFDKKAEEATMELILAQEELKKVKEQKESLELDIDDLKVKLLNYLKQLKTNDPISSQQQQQQQQINLRLRHNSHNYLLGDYESIESMELKQSINEQRQVLQILNEEIIAKKREIDSLKDKSESFVQQFKSEQRIHENSLNQIKQQTEDYNTKYVNFKQKLEDLSNEIRMKMDAVHEKTLEAKNLDECLNRLKSQSEDEQKKMEKLEKLINEKEEHLETMQENQQKFIENLELIENNKIELLKTMEKLNNDFKLEKLNYEQTKKLNDDLIQTKNNLELKIQHLNEEFSKLSADYDHRDQQINKLKMQIKEKQQLLKREEDILSELFYEKENLIEQIEQLKDRQKKKENEFKRIEETNKQLESKLNLNQQEIQELVAKLNNLKYELETSHENLKQSENRLKELNKKIENKHASYEQLDENFNQKRSELENMELYVHEIKSQIQQESKQLLAVQAENSKQKKTNDELKSKAKNLNRILESSENLQATIHELQESLSEKSRLIEQKDVELKEKDKEIEQLIRDFLKVQDEAKSFSSQLRQLEEALGNHSSNSHSSLATHKRDSINSKHAGSGGTLQPKSLISSLLITPNINKSRARSCCLQTSNNLACCTDLNNYATSYESRTDKNQENNCCLDEQERLKHQLAQNFKENEFIFERGKTQTQNILDNLKLSLNEIELLTANNIFQITNLSKS